MGYHKSIGCKRARCHRASTIEAEPTKPEQCRTKKRQGQVMGRHGLVTIAFSLPYDQGRRQRSDSRADMNDKSSCKIKGAKIPDPATHAPDPMGERIVDKGCPQDEEDKISLEFKPLCKCAGDESGGNHRKHHLKDHECLVRNGGGVVGEGIKSHTVQTDPFKTSYEMANIRAKCETISIKNPLDGDDSEGDKALHDRPQNIFRSHHASVEEGKAWCHQHD